MHGAVGITAVTASNAAAGIAAFDGVPAVEYICIIDRLQSSADINQLILSVADSAYTQTQCKPNSILFMLSIS
jgi:hypothetical protein